MSDFLFGNGDMILANFSDHKADNVSAWLTFVVQLIEQFDGGENMSS